MIAVGTKFLPDFVEMLLSRVGVRWKTRSYAAARTKPHNRTNPLHDSISVPVSTAASLPRRSTFITIMRSAMTTGKVLVDFKSEGLYQMYVM